MTDGGEEECGKRSGKDFGNEARRGIISVRNEGGLMRKRETRNEKSNDKIRVQ
jgi:hypothetical protein